MYNAIYIDILSSNISNSPVMIHWRQKLIFHSSLARLSSSTTRASCMTLGKKHPATVKETIQKVGCSKHWKSIHWREKSLKTKNKTLEFSCVSPFKEDSLSYFYICWTRFTRISKLCQNFLIQRPFWRKLQLPGNKWLLEIRMIGYSKNTSFIFFNLKGFLLI